MAWKATCCHDSRINCVVRLDLSSPSVLSRFLPTYQRQSQQGQHGDGLGKVHGRHCCGSTRTDQAPCQKAGSLKTRRNGRQDTTRFPGLFGTCMSMETATMHILVAGAQGQLGVRLMEAATVAGVSVTGLDREGMDVASRDSVRLPSIVQPTVVINAAAYTAVDMAESQREAAMAVNARGTQHLAEACQVGHSIDSRTRITCLARRPSPLLPSDMPCPEGVRRVQAARRRSISRIGRMRLRDPCFVVVRRAGREFFANDASPCRGTDRCRW